jgi:hypothetical protein
MEQNPKDLDGLKDIVTVAMLAKKLCVTPRCIQRWIRLGKLPECRAIGRRQFWFCKEILPIIRACSLQKGGNK